MRALIAVVLLVSALPAAAADRCRSGASALGDRRALAALEAALDTACPCRSAASRGTYQACARGVVKGQTLRRECRRTATDLIRGTDCGSKSVPCGRFAAKAKRPIGCSLRAAAACRGGRGFEAHACTKETRCADVVDWTAGTCQDPRDGGPYAAGVRVVRFTKKSAVDPTQDRVLDTIVWYPTTLGSGPVDGTYAGVFDAPLVRDGAPYPLLMFSHGSCGYPLQSKFLTPLIATYGFIVVAVPHPGNEIYEFATCGLRQSLVDSAVERPQDIHFVLDGMLAANGDPSSPFPGAIDPARLGMSGHSFGGLTTYLAATQDARYKIALPMAPAVPGTPVLTIPSLTMFGQGDHVVPLPPIETAYGAARTPKLEVQIENTGHYAFSDGCFPGPDCQPPTTLTQAEAHALVVRWVIPFLQRYLAGRTDVAPLLSPAGASGVVVKSE